MHWAMCYESMLNWFKKIKVLGWSNMHFECWNLLYMQPDLNVHFVLSGTNALLWSPWPIVLL